MDSEKEKKLENYLRALDKDEIIELYLQKCFDADIEKRYLWDKLTDEDKVKLKVLSQIKKKSDEILDRVTNIDDPNINGALTYKRYHDELVKWIDYEIGFIQDEMFVTLLVDCGINDLGE